MLFDFIFIAWQWKRSIYIIYVSLGTTKYINVFEITNMFLVLQN